MRVHARVCLACVRVCVRCEFVRALCLPLLLLLLLLLLLPFSADHSPEAFLPERVFELLLYCGRSPPIKVVF